MKPLSRKTETFTESVIREMTRICDEVDGINLAQGMPDFPAPAAVKDAAGEAIEADHNQYPVTFGEPELRQAIAEKAAWQNDLDVDPETEITVTCGATEAMISTLQALINPGDEIVIFEPFYENYGPDTILSGASPRYVTLSPPDWTFDPGELADAFTEDTKAVVLNTPNNPTGRVFSQDELRTIADHCEDVDAYAVTDEIYEHILYDGAEHVSMASLDGMRERTVTINSISKTYSLTGWRVGWAIAPPRMTDRIRKVHDFLTVGAPTPFQHAAAHALKLDRDYYDSLAERYESARDTLCSTLERAGFRPWKPEGAYYIMADASDVLDRIGAAGTDEPSKAILRHTGVATVPGYSFYSDPEDGRNQVRFCYCKREQTLDRVKEAFARRLPGPGSDG